MKSSRPVPLFSLDCEWLDTILLEWVIPFSCLVLWNFSNFLSRIWHPYQGICSCLAIQGSSLYAHIVSPRPVIEHLALERYLSFISGSKNKRPLPKIQIPHNVCELQISLYLNFLAILNFLGLYPNAQSCKANYSKIFSNRKRSMCTMWT